MPDRPSCVRSTNEVSEHTHAYPQSSEPMGPVRRHGKEAGLARIGINIQRLQTGTRSSWLHADENQEEFVYVIAGQADTWIDGHVHPMQQGGLAAFPAGTGLSHCFINDTGQETVLLAGGEAPKPGRRIFYPLRPDQCRRIRRQAPEGEFERGHHAPDAWAFEGTSLQEIRSG